MVVSKLCRVVDKILERGGEGCEVGGWLYRAAVCHFHFTANGFLRLVFYCCCAVMQCDILSSWVVLSFLVIKLSGLMLL